ncbi:hypothetical protein, partial [Microbispora rosea]|uniref:hypothetical protein n=1 Tax=Microbispora rosea TaxID=58117 RepID=UPI001E4BDF74
ADRVLVVREGRIVHEAPAEDLDEHQVLDLVMVSAEQTTGTGPASETASGPASDSASGSVSGSDSRPGSDVAIPPSEGAFDD